MRAAPHTLILAMVGVLAGCAVGPNYERPHDALPPSYSPADKAPVTDQAVSDKDLPAQWWELFHSPALNQLVEDSLKHKIGRAHV